jgi:flagellar biosynthesis protein FlhF
MKSETFRATSLDAALARVKAVLGDDAAIVETRRDADGQIAVVACRAVRPPGTDAPVVDVVVGPPGDGKTAVVAKLALGARRAGVRVGLVAADAHRVGAAAELEAVGRVLGVRVARANDAGGLAAALARMADLDRVLVDTAGAGPRQAARLTELAALVDAAGGRARRTLVVAGTTASEVVAGVLAAFAPLGPATAVVTKADIASPSAVTSQISGHGVIVAGVSSGPRVVDPLLSTGRGGLAHGLLAA